MIRILWIMWLAVLTHLLWGVLLLNNGEVVTGITAIHHTMELGFSVTGLGLSYLVIAGLAALGLRTEMKGYFAIVCVLPQQFFLVYSAIGAVQAIWHSSFADGVMRPRAFIAADQAPVIFLAILHTCAFTEGYIRRLSQSF